MHLQQTGQSGPVERELGLSPVSPEPLKGGFAKVLRLVISEKNLVAKPINEIF